MVVRLFVKRSQDDYLSFFSKIGQDILSFLSSFLQQYLQVIAAGNKGKTL
jgi:hypothetical protein